MRKELAQPDFLKDFIGKAGPPQQYQCLARAKSTHRRLSGTVMPNRLFHGPHFLSDGPQGEGSRVCKPPAVCLGVLLRFSSADDPIVERRWGHHVRTRCLSGALGELPHAAAV